MYPNCGVGTSRLRLTWFCFSGAAQAASSALSTGAMFGVTFGVLVLIMLVAILIYLVKVSWLRLMPSIATNTSTTACLCSASYFVTMYPVAEPTGQHQNCQGDRRHRLVIQQQRYRQRRRHASQPYANASVSKHQQGSKCTLLRGDASTSAKVHGDILPIRVNTAFFAWTWTAHLWHVGPTR